MVTWMLTSNNICFKIKRKISLFKGVIMEKGKKGKYQGTTTFLQRKLMIESYLETHNITKSCNRAGVSINTFRRWYPRYLKGGLEGIKRPKSHVNKHLGKIDKKIKNRVIELKKQHPLWGRRTIAFFLRTENNDRNIISPSGVQKVLKKAGLWGK